MQRDHVFVVTRKLHARILLIRGFSVIDSFFSCADLVQFHTRMLPEGLEEVNQ